MTLGMRQGWLSIFCTLLQLIGIHTSADDVVRPLPAQRTAWSENTGWLVSPTNTVGMRAVLTPDGGYLQGYLWSPSIGWIALGSDLSGPYFNTGPADWGVNVSSSWELSGYAWSEAIGWIDFNQVPSARIYPGSGAIDGYAWSENVGWMRWRSSESPSPLVYGIVLDLPEDSVLTNTANYNVLYADSTRRVGWSENAGWISAPTNGAGMRATLAPEGGYLQGYLWSQSIGWIALGSEIPGPYPNNGPASWGVNLDANGVLSGYAWSETAGWISFNHDPVCRIHQQRGVLDGYAWSENIGWIRWGSGGIPSPLTYGMALAVPLDNSGTPLWWVSGYGFTNEMGEIVFDSTSDTDGDGLSDGDEFIAGTNPRESESVPAWYEIKPSPGGLTLGWSAARFRYYRVDVATNMSDAGEGWVEVLGFMGENQEFLDLTLPPSPKGVFRVRVSMDPPQHND